MIGIIHKVLFDLLDQMGGDELSERVGAKAGIPPSSVRISDAYTDAGFSKLLVTALAETGMTRSDFVQAYADAFLAYAQGLFPAFFEMSGDARDFLLRQPKIHSSLGAGLVGEEDREKVRQKFQVADNEDGTLTVTYQSAVGLCDLYQALAGKIADHYGDRLQVGVVHCGKGAGCTMKLDFDPPPGKAFASACDWCAAS